MGDCLQNSSIFVWAYTCLEQVLQVLCGHQLTDFQKQLSLNSNNLDAKQQLRKIVFQHKSND